MSFEESGIPNCNSRNPFLRWPWGRRRPSREHEPIPSLMNPTPGRGSGGDPSPQHHLNPFVGPSPIPTGPQSPVRALSLCPRPSGDIFDQVIHSVTSPGSGRIDSELDPNGASTRTGTFGSQRGAALRGKAKFRARFPLKCVLTVSLCFFTVVPALILWFVSWQSGSDGINAMQVMGERSVESVAAQLRNTMIDSVQNSLLNFFGGAEAAIRVMVNLVQGDDTLSHDGFDFDVVMRHRITAFQAIRAFEWVSMSQFIAYTNITITSPTTTRQTSQSYTYGRLHFNLLTGQNTDAIYMALLHTSAAGNESVLEYSALDQRTGDVALQLFKQPVGGFLYSTFSLIRDSECVWENDIEFNSNTGLPQILLSCFLYNTMATAVYTPIMYTNMYTISAYLRSLLGGAKERLFVCFRTVKGTLVGSSHGKFFSHSNIDFAAINPILSPPDISVFRAYSAVDSDDELVNATGLWILSVYGHWNTVPNLDVLQMIRGESFWLASSQLTTPLGLQLQMYYLIDRGSRMAPIEKFKASTVSDIQTTNTRLTILFSFIVVIALMFAMTVSYILSQALHRLAMGMNALAMLRFHEDENETDDSVMARKRSYFSEVSKCQGSFFVLERGIRAFIKYVPRDVVRMMLTGEMESDNSMIRKTLTILFMDIVGFSTMCERIRADQLILLTTQYLQAMCEIIVGSGGVLDKFVGDCIMAIWNAPRSTPRHASAACGAAIDMQARLYRLCESWRVEGLPEIKYRVGINTARVWVGNFGCDYRISYTCLGDGVNLASRLESANKCFGTVVLISESTLEGARNEFVFRLIGRITVRGKAEVLSAFELVCRAEMNAISSTPRGNTGGGCSAMPVLGRQITAVTTFATMLPLETPRATTTATISPRHSTSFHFQSPPLHSLSSLNTSNNNSPPGTRQSVRVSPRVGAGPAGVIGIGSATVNQILTQTAVTALNHSNGSSAVDGEGVRRSSAMTVESATPSLSTPGSSQFPFHRRPTSFNPVVPDVSGIPSTESLLFHWEYVHSQSLSAIIQHYHKGIQDYIIGDISQAERHFNEALAVLPSDGPTKVLLGLCKVASEKIEKEGLAMWDGVMRLETF